MSRQNIECFELTAGALLGTLYHEFPRPYYLKCSTFQEALQKSDILPPHCAWDASHRPGLTLISATMNWLMEEGYVRADGGLVSVAFKDCILTSRGFQALNTPLEVGEETIGEKLSPENNSLSKFATSELLKAVISVGTKAGVEVLMRQG